jgi:hypothetical protein
VGRREAAREGKPVSSACASASGVSGVEAMELVDHFSQTTRLRFTSIQRNPKLDGSEFRFTPPKGVDVLGDK